MGIRAANMRNNMEKKRKPELLRTFLASFPIPRYSRPIRTPIPMWEEILRWVSTWRPMRAVREVAVDTGVHRRRCLTESLRMLRKVLLNRMEN